MDSGYWIAIGVYLFVGACTAATISLLLLSRDDDTLGCGGCLAYLILDTFIFLLWPVTLVAMALTKLINRGSKDNSDDEGQSE